MGCLSVELNKSNPTNFELAFPLVPNQSHIGAAEELILNIHGAVLPAFNVPHQEVQWQTATRKVPSGPIEFEIMQVQFVVDAQFKNWKLLYNWMTYIANNKDKMLEQYENFAIDSTLRIIDNFGTNVLGIDFTGMWPTNLQEVSFSTKEGEILLEAGATFVFDYFSIRENI
jgi:hypothetical protein